jgi:hypothetical protein
MRLQMPHVTLARPAAKLLVAASLALAGGMSLSAGSAPIRLVCRDPARSVDRSRRVAQRLSG